jgi:O-antigen/teichoic acid export membrane protein
MSEREIINNKKKILAEAILETEEVSTAIKFPRNIRNLILSLIEKKQIFIGGGSLVLAGVISNVLNYFFNAYLGRVLNFDDFSLIGLVGGLFSFASILFGAYSMMVNFRSSFLIGKYGEAAGYHFWEYSKKQILIPTIIGVSIWLLLSPLLMTFFHTSNIYIFILFSFVLLVGFITNVNQGFLSAKMMFGSLAIIALIDPAVRLIVMFLLVSVGLKSWTFASIPIATIADFVATWILLKKGVHKEKTTAPMSEIQTYSKKFFFVSILTGFSSIAFFTVDIFLAKHFLSPMDAGKYVLVSLVGKMIFFLGNLTAPFVIPFIARYEGSKRNSQFALYILLIATFLFTFPGFIIFGVFGNIVIPLLYGSKAFAIVSYILPYTFGIMCYTISNVLVNYYLVRKVYTFTLATSLLIFVQIIGIQLFHNSFGSLTMVMSGVLVLHLLITTVLHFAANHVKKFEKEKAHRLQFMLSRLVKQYSL